MKLFKNLLITILIIGAILLISYYAYENGMRPTNVNNEISKDNVNEVDKDEVPANKVQENVNEDKNQSEDENGKGEEEKQEKEEFVGKEEAESQKDNNTKEEQATNNKENETEKELVGEEKAVDIITKKYAYEGQKVTFDHMEGKDYVIKIKDGTALTWYIVNGDTWEAEEY